MRWLITSIMEVKFEFAPTPSIKLNNSRAINDNATVFALNINLNKTAGLIFHV